MNIKCIDFNEDTNVITLELDEEAKQFLLEFAVNELLKKALDNFDGTRKYEDT